MDPQQGRFAVVKAELEELRRQEEAERIKTYTEITKQRDQAKKAKKAAKKERIREQTLVPISDPIDIPEPPVSPKQAIHNNLRMSTRAVAPVAAAKQTVMTDYYGWLDDSPPPRAHAPIVLDPKFTEQEEEGEAVIMSVQQALDQHSRLIHDLAVNMKNLLKIVTHHREAFKKKHNE